MLEEIEYAEWKNNLRISNGIVEAVVTLDVGPRIMRFGMSGGVNLLKEFPGDLGGAGEKEWKIRGGHRLWHAPEAIPRTYVLDNGPARWERVDNLGASVTPPPEPENSVQRALEIRMRPDSPALKIIHRITNIGRWPVELSCWALTAMAEGGKAIVPLPKPRPHFDMPNPAYMMAAWSYTDMADPRLRFGKDHLLIDHSLADASLKLGLSVPDGWAAYARGGALFVKEFGWSNGARYPDGGCNFETYSEKSFIELESLGPLSVIAPGETIEHAETWRVLTDFPELIDNRILNGWITSELPKKEA